MKTATEYREQFEELVQRAEKEMNDQPEAYKRRLKWLTLLGYGVITGATFLLALLLVGVLWAATMDAGVLEWLADSKVILLLIFFSWVLGRALFIRIEPPDGYELKKEFFPQVWVEVETLGKKLGTAPIDQIILTNEMNAAIIQIPRFGIVGPYQNTLVLGLELLMALSTEQARAVLAHEMAHLSGSHNKFTGWIYRARMIWLSISHAFHRTSAWEIQLVRRFVDWYTPYLTGYSFVLARDNEYEADALASKLTSRDATASALVVIHVYGELLEREFWRPFYRKAYKRYEPEDNVYQQLQQFFKNREIHADEFNRCLRQALSRKTDPADTHPALMERLKALKALGLKATNSPDSALVWLGRGSEYVFNHFNQVWLKDNQDQWHQYHQNARAAQEAVNKLSDQGWMLLDREEKWQWASLMDQYLPDADPLPLFHRYHKDYPSDMDAVLAVGRLLLKREDERGISFIERAMQSQALQLAAAEEAWRYYTRHDEHQQAAHWLRKLEQATDMMRESQEERESLNNKDILMLPDNALEKGGEALEAELLGELPANKQVKEVWVALKKIRYFRDNPVFVLAIKPTQLIVNADTFQDELLNSLQTTRTVFIVTTTDNPKLAQRVMEIGKRLY